MCRPLCSISSRNPPSVTIRQEVAATDPDSALILIDSVLNIRALLDDDTRMDISLMQAEALFGHPDGERRELSRRIKTWKIYTMPELERAAGFYAENKDYHKAAFAAIYSGYVLRELRADDEAMVSFKDAAKYAELAGDSLTFARAQYNVARLLYEKHLENQAADLLYKTEKAFGDKYDERALAINLMAGSNIIMGHYDFGIFQSIAIIMYTFYKIISSKINFNNKVAFS